MKWGASPVPCSRACQVVDYVDLSIRILFNPCAGFEIWSARSVISAPEVRESCSSTTRR